ncbi:hypothetical protein ACHAW6_002664 [Cyclotella cf. meneghiniana]
MVWVSKLKTEMALSTMEVEIIALVHCCHELFPVMDIVSEVGNTVGFTTKDMASMHVSIHEDKAGGWSIGSCGNHTTSIYSQEQVLCHQDGLVQRGNTKMWC